MCAGVSVCTQKGSDLNLTVRSLFCYWLDLLGEVVSLVEAFGV